MNELVLTVSMANYNHGHYLEKRISSFLHSLPQDSELIIVDDGSTDNSVEIIERFALKDKRIKFYKNETNKGVIFTTNLILKKAKGLYLTFQSADDIILPDFFPKILKTAKEFPQAAICCSDFARCFENEESKIHSTRLIESVNEPTYFNSTQLLKVFRTTRFWIPGHTSIVKREKVLEGGGFDPRLKHLCDWYLLHTIALQGGVAYLPETLSVIRVLPTSFSASAPEQEKRALYLVLFDQLKRKTPSARLFRRSLLANSHIKSLSWQLLLRPPYWDLLVHNYWGRLSRRMNNLLLRITHNKAV